MLAKIEVEPIIDIEQEVEIAFVFNDINSDSWKLTLFTNPAS